MSLRAEAKERVQMAPAPEGGELNSGWFAMASTISHSLPEGDPLSAIPSQLKGVPVVGQISSQAFRISLEGGRKLIPVGSSVDAGLVGYIVRRLMALVRNSFPKVRIRIRLDGGFANPELLSFLDSEPGIEYVVAMASSAVLNRKAEEAMQYARVLAGLTDQTEHVYGEARYAAGSWKRERRVIIKAEVVRAEEKAPKDTCKACRNVRHSNFTLPSSSSAILCRANSSLAGRSRIMQARCLLNNLCSWPKL